MIQPSNQLTIREFQKFRDLIYEHVGIHLKPEKRELLNARLGKRLRACGMSGFEEYYDFITSEGQREGEFVLFIDAVSTNFTSFFRESSHFDYLVATALPSYVKEHGAKNRELMVWSAASSSGEEPYTLAMVLDNFRRQAPSLRFKIMATDISTKVLLAAKRGVYAEEQVKKVPPEFLKNYFQKGVGQCDGQVKLKEQIRRLVSFKRFNLMDELPWQEELDIIFCRNVMIYFDRLTQQTLINKFYKSLRPGGYLFIGHSESISCIKHDFVQVEATTYRKL
jgi:chemotaxis protein methyltransferase CheR